jgi:protein-tyrosine phosphatase
MKILFVCLGNICRSPLAEAMFLTLLRRRSSPLCASVFADSAGTSAWHLGEPADARMRAAAERCGVVISHRSRLLVPQDLETFDLILAMDRDNLRDTRKLARTREQKEKVQLFRDYDPQGTGVVPDPYYSGPDGFELVISIAERTCMRLIETIEETR